jgi:hypothetical protein
MPDIEEQLRRYGAALETHLVDNAAELREASEAHVRGPRGRRVRVGLIAAVLVSAALIAAAIYRSEEDRSVVSTTPSTTTTSGPAGAPVFSSPTNTVLLFTDGIDGATAVDLDRGIAGRRVIQGERAGDQAYRLTLTGDHLVVGWGEIYAAPLGGGESTKIADSTIYVPASEPGEVWTINWQGGVIGAGAATLRRVRVDGTVTFTAKNFDPQSTQPILGVPGGLLVDTDHGLTIWDAAAGTTGAILGPGPADAVAFDGRTVAWCESRCRRVHEAEIDHVGLPTAPHVAPGAQQIVLSSDGSVLAYLRPAAANGSPPPSSGDRADLVIRERASGREEVVATNLDALGSLQWASDRSQLLYTESSYQASTMRVGRWDLEAHRWELRRLSVGDGIAALPITRSQAQSFFSGSLTRAADCPGAGGGFPSGRRGVCSFAISASD